MRACMQRFPQLSHTRFSFRLHPLTNPNKLPRIHGNTIATVKDPSAASRLDCANVFVWNTMIRKQVENGLVTRDPPLLYYIQGLRAGLRPNGHTFMYLLKALVSGQEIKEGEEVHASVVRTGFACSEFVSGALLGFYVACGLVGKGRQVFDEMRQPGLVLWTLIIRAYVCVTLPEKALELFRTMREVGLTPDMVAVSTVVSACGLLGDLGVAKAMHCFIEKSGIEVDAFVSSTLISTYGECGSLDYAYRFFQETPMKNIVVWNTMIHQSVEHNNLELGKQLFQSMPDRDVVSWNSMIGVFARIGQYQEALTWFHEMEFSGVSPNTLTLLSTLSACASHGALDTGAWIHAYVDKNDMNRDGSLDSSLIDMYSKCGDIDKAVQIFEESTRRDLFTWTSIVCGLAMHGRGEKALHYFSKMKEAQVQPDDVTMVGILSACAHAGLLDQGWWYFQSMEKVFGLVPKVEHYGCMVDLLGRMGCLKEAYDLIMGMPMEANEIIWGAFLSACRVHNNVELGEVAARRLLGLDPRDPWAQVMLSNMYAEEAKWDRSMGLRKEIKRRG
ncbi:Pentatricopeptide repeat-containing protein, chloroplastic [Vitis vinifera]|uniref:Pentatricopeptide repeat-containing protein, chloroplastic n=1 Tax=Vitis vinifera TaxID=29760 RepID=A0A438KHE1_VITVI|nr:Pentatricopeptide repeat-containing protein, chloroplastic [Vitis vinifera]